LLRIARLTIAGSVAEFANGRLILSVRLSWNGRCISSYDRSIRFLPFSGSRLICAARFRENRARLSTDGTILTQDSDALALDRLVPSGRGLRNCNTTEGSLARAVEDIGSHPHTVGLVEVVVGNMMESAFEAHGSGHTDAADTVAAAHHRVGNMNS
jgi:hypothetical protein